MKIFSIISCSRNSKYLNPFIFSSKVEKFLKNKTVFFCFLAFNTSPTVSWQCLDIFSSKYLFLVLKCKKKKWVLMTFFRKVTQENLYHAQI